MDSALGVPRNAVSVVPHNPRWADLFECAAADLRQCLGAQISGIEHIGSTAVPGLDAKPILDLMAAVPSLHLPKIFFDDLSGIGYEYRPLDTVAERLFFAKGSEVARTHYLSVCESRSPFWVSHIAFRDRLRAERQLAQAYAALKRELAQRFPNDRRAYTDAKEQFILAAIGTS